jgi:uncharacterized membrane protein YebE (DUF533 family)
MVTKFNTQAKVATKGFGGIVILLGLGVVGYLAYRHFSKKKEEKAKQ